MSRITPLALTVALLVLLALPGVANAQQPAGNAYGGQGAVAQSVAPGTGQSAGDAGGRTGVKGASGSGGSNSDGQDGGAGGAGEDGGASTGPGTGAVAGAAGKLGTVDGGSLPFTGFDVLLLALGGAGLLLVGLSLRRLGRET